MRGGVRLRGVPLGDHPADERLVARFDRPAEDLGPTSRPARAAARRPPRPGSHTPSAGPLASVQVAQQRDLGPMVDGLPVDVQHQVGHGELGPRPLGRPAGLGQPGVAQPAHSRDPGRVHLVELGQRRRRCVPVLELLPVTGQARRSATPPAPRTRPRSGGPSATRWSSPAADRGAGSANSTTYSPAPTAIGADDFPGAAGSSNPHGSQRYSASLIPTIRGRNWSPQCQPSCWTTRRRFQSMSMRPTLEAIAVSNRPQ